MNSHSKKLFSLLPLIGFAIIALSIVISILLFPNFSFLKHYVSNLGNPSITSAYWIFNVGLIVGPIFFFVFLFKLRKQTSDNLREIIFFCLIFIATIGVILVGLLPENFPLEHDISAGIAFGGYLIGMMEFLITDLHKKAIGISAPFNFRIFTGLVLVVSIPSLIISGTIYLMKPSGLALSAPLFEWIGFVLIFFWVFILVWFSISSPSTD